MTANQLGKTITEVILLRQAPLNPCAIGSPKLDPASMRRC